MSRRDDVTDLYKPSERLEIAEKILFVTDIAAAAVSLVSNQMVSSIAITAQIVVALLYFICSTVDDGIFWYQAERQRRKNNIENGFGSRLSEFETDGYYNNNVEPSLEKYSLNTMESNFFSKEIAEKMLLKSSIMAIIAIVALVIACRFVNNPDALLILAQTAFSAYVLVDWIMLVIYKVRLETLYKDAYDTLIILNSEGVNQKAWSIAYIVEYEAIKAHYKVRLDGKIFTKCNDELSLKWQEILSHRDAVNTENNS